MKLSSGSIPEVRREKMGKKRGDERQNTPKLVSVRDQIRYSLYRYPRLFELIEKRNREIREKLGDDDLFGNSKDYKPILGNGIGGYYREPMDAGQGMFREMLQNSEIWNIPNSYKESQQFSQDNELGLSMRQPGWSERFQELDEYLKRRKKGILTLREYPEIAKTISPENIWGNEISVRASIYGKIAVAWHHFIEDLKRGRENYRKKKREEKIRRKKRNKKIRELKRAKTENKTK